MGFTTYSAPELERSVLDEVSLEEPWALLERFSTLVRSSGSTEERQAFNYITDRLDAFGVPYTLHEPTCYISWPGPASVRVVGEDARRIAAKTQAMAPSTDGQELIGELVYIPGPPGGRGRERGSGRRTITQDLRGKILITDGMGMNVLGLDLGASGALAAIFVNPGERIHEGIGTWSWGSPDLGTLGRTPPVPILGVNRPDGEKLIECAQAGGCQVAVSTRVETRWRSIPVLVAEIAGRQAPEEFVLLHGHVDSWHVGIGDNATGNATMLELARVLNAHRGRLDRTVRIAWWSGHSHGRYAGSTWYADEFARDLVNHCVAHINCDSPGCRWATEYRNVTLMAESAEMAKAAIRDASGQDATTTRVPRAGDCSFSNLGVTTYFMLSSTMPEALVREKDYYPVGGCGGNIAWHTEDDTLAIADRENLLRDMRVYALGVLRAANATIHPFDYRHALDEIVGSVGEYRRMAADHIDLSPVLDAAAELRSVLDAFYARVEAVASAASPFDQEARRLNRAQRQIARELVNVSYTASGRYRHDPARWVPPVPALAAATEFGGQPDTDRINVLVTDLRRGRNHVIGALDRARAAAETVISP